MVGLSESPGGVRGEGLHPQAALRRLPAHRPRPRHADRHRGAPADVGHRSPPAAPSWPRGARRPSGCARCCAACACAPSAASCSTSRPRSTAPRATPASTRTTWRAGSPTPPPRRRCARTWPPPARRCRRRWCSTSAWPTGRAGGATRARRTRSSASADGVRIAVPGFQPFQVYDVITANLLPGVRRADPAGVGRRRCCAGPARRSPPRRSRWCATSASRTRARSSAGWPRRSTSGADGFWTLPATQTGLAAPAPPAGPERLPGADAAADDVDHPRHALPATRLAPIAAALAGGADHGDRARRRRARRPGRAASCHGRCSAPGMRTRRHSAVLADVDAAGREGSASIRSASAGDVEPRDPRDGPALLAPARHAAGQVAHDPVDADGGGEAGGAAGRRRRRAPPARPPAPAARASPGGCRSRSAAR